MKTTLLSSVEAQNPPELHSPSLLIGYGATLQIENCSIRDSESVGIIAHGESHLQISSCRFENRGSFEVGCEAIRIENASGTFEIADCEFDHNGYGIGVRGPVVGTVKLEGCKVTHNMIGIMQSGCADLNVIKSKFGGNLVDLILPDEARAAVISDCEFAHPATHAPNGT